ncbi:mechanosensitive ion channel family protein [Mechercharimyces sp. CAU 1602]|uniref:mechanosensitive ion channel family protein n=1 Tax=Mechercharimyces sp. CAU 1602 TaxID=2973933 RepID=UPI002161669B|nr:mechanosensitive ion channel family protein [Mechercharimyces sp. CAU 1602]MCS1352033.1 mechanosensitive ion channel family protein [Mechercharimyces sp. CAU 1602]
MMAVDDLLKNAEETTDEIVNNPTLFLTKIMEEWLYPVVKVALIVVLAMLALKFSARFIDRIFELRRDGNKNVTLSRLIQSTARYVIYFLAGLMILYSGFGINPAPLLAGAGIVGLAIGFGAQSLVKDVISGFFLIFDNQMEVGNYVELNGKVQGVVEEIGLRVSRIRAFDGRMQYVSNGEITQVSNYSRDEMRPLVNVKVPYEADVSLVWDVLDDICADIGRRYAPYLKESPSILGITSIQDNGTQFTLMALCEADQYWFIEREIRKAVVERLNKEEISLAYPRRVVDYVEAQSDEGVVRKKGSFMSQNRAGEAD